MQVYLKLILDINNMDIIKNKKQENINISISEHFKFVDFACPCCNQVLINRHLVDKLEQLIAIINTNINIINAFKCNKFNNIDIDNKKDYTLGNIVDFDLNGNKNAIETFINTTKIFNKVGLLYNNENRAIIHVNINSDEKNSYWLCNKVNGVAKYTYFTAIEHLLAYINIDKSIDWNKLII